MGAFRFQAGARLVAAALGAYVAAGAAPSVRAASAVAVQAVPAREQAALRRVERVGRLARLHPEQVSSEARAAAREARDIAVLAGKRDAARGDQARDLANVADALARAAQREQQPQIRALGAEVEARAARLAAPGAARGTVVLP